MSKSSRSRDHRRSTFAALVARLVTYHAGRRALFIARLDPRSFDVFALMNLGPLGL